MTTSFFRSKIFVFPKQDYFLTTCAANVVGMINSNLRKLKRYNFMWKAGCPIVKLSCRCLSEVLGNSLLEVCSWHLELHSPRCTALCIVPGAIKCTIQWTGMGHLYFLLWTLSGRVETDFWHCKTFEASKEEKWRSIEQHCFGLTLHTSRVNQLC